MKSKKGCQKGCQSTWTLDTLNYLYAQQKMAKMLRKGLNRAYAGATELRASLARMVV